MAPEEIKAVRQELGCSARELAAALGIDQETVLAWERAELFPTKRFVDKMAELRKQGPSAIPRTKRRKKAAPPRPEEALADPEVWRLFRKILVHGELRASVAKLAEGYDDPAER